MATHSSVLAWRIPGTGEPGGLPSMRSHRVGHDWSDLADLLTRSVCVMQEKLQFPWGSAPGVGGGGSPPLGGGPPLPVRLRILSVDYNSQDASSCRSRRSTSCRGVSWATVAPRVQEKLKMGGVCGLRGKLLGAAYFFRSHKTFADLQQSVLVRGCLDLWCARAWLLNWEKGLSGTCTGGPGLRWSSPSALPWSCPTSLRGRGRGWQSWVFLEWWIVFFNLYIFAGN